MSAVLAGTLPHYLARDACTVNGMVIPEAESSWMEIKIYSFSVMPAFEQTWTPFMDNLE